MNNVISDFGLEYEIVQGSYLSEVFLILEKQLEGFKDYLFVVHDNNSDDEYMSSYFDHPKKILLHRGGEEKKSSLEKLKGKYHHIFANYYWECDNVTSIPLGYHSFLEDKVERVSMKDRTYDLNFIGALNRNRISFASNILKLNSFWLIVGLYFYKEKILKWINHYLLCRNNNDQLQFNYDFNNGIDKKDFVNRLRLSKIALCPKGFYNTECFRLYEAMRYGCVVITESLPQKEFYKNIPAFQIKNWEDGMALTKILLKDESLLERLSIDSCLWYEKYFSPEATAKVMIDKINGLKK